MAWYRLIVETNCVGCDKVEDFEVPDEQLALAPDDAERERIVASYAQDVLENLISWGCTPIDAPSEAGRG